jgi:hypothetical protein
VLADIIQTNLQELAYMIVTVSIGCLIGSSPAAISCELECNFMTLLTFVSMITKYIP